jgi:hypothetical protein
MKQSVCYNRSIFGSAIDDKPIAAAIETKGAKATRDDVRKGFDGIKTFSLGGASRRWRLHLRTTRVKEFSDVETCLWASFFSRHHGTRYLA